MKLQRYALLAMLTLTGTVNAEMVVKPIAYQIDGKPYSGMLVYDDSVKTPRPGIMMVPSWMGPTDVAADKAKPFEAQ
jgi:hypothetical protein